jgi:RimJ/RimL family protein N-acetyltransferase
MVTRAEEPQRVPELETERLLVTPLSLDRAHAAMTDRDLLRRQLHAEIPDEWPNREFAEFLPLLAQQLLQEPPFADWIGLIIHRQERVLVGDIGFKGLPDSGGTVEIGYSVVPEYQGRGFATEATRAMIRWAFSNEAVETVTASCLNDNAPSIRVLQKAGMTEVRRDGPLLWWALRHPDRSD